MTEINADGLVKLKSFVEYRWNAVENAQFGQETFTTITKQTAIDYLARRLSVATNEERDKINMEFGRTILNLLSEITKLK